MISNRFIYSLRYTIDPAHHPDERTEALIQFCGNAKVDDVIFFVDCEELNSGHISPEELTPWLSRLRTAKTRLEQRGITFSVNPWATLLHADRGRKLKDGQNFTLMVDPYGCRASAQVCPLCGEWRDYIVGIYKKYAELKPNILWIEDDFRFHNHAPLTWGGCFCDDHLSLFSEKIGKTVSRSEFINAVLKPGDPHEYRKVWLDTARKTLIDVAALIEQAVHRESPGTKLGLMSSSPCIHAAEGRDWHNLLNTLSGDTVSVVRPHLPSYIETTPQDYFKNFITKSQLTTANLPMNVEIYPELDNGPFSRFSKSETFTRFQIETAPLLRSQGITMSLFDMMGNGVLREEGMEKMLSETKEFVNNIVNRIPPTASPEGIKVLFSHEESYYLQTVKGSRMEELYPEEPVWAVLLGAYGFPVVLTQDTNQTDSVVAVSGQFLRSVSEEGIRKLFDLNYMLLDGEAAAVLIDRGLGGIIQADRLVWHEQNSGYQTYEEISNGKKYCGIKEARMSAQNLTGDYAEIIYNGTQSALSVVKNYEGKKRGEGVTLINGRHVVFPYGRFRGRLQSHLYPVRKALISGLIRNFEPSSDLVCIEGIPYGYITQYRDKGKLFLLLANFSNDSYPGIPLNAPRLNSNKIHGISNKHRKPQKIKITSDNGLTRLEMEFKRLDVLFLISEEER
jgi:hypothetical protein